MNELQVRALVQDELRRLLAPLASGGGSTAKRQTVKSIGVAASALNMGKAEFKGLMTELKEGTHYWQSNGQNARVPRYEFDVDAIREYQRSR